MAENIANGPAATVAAQVWGKDATFKAAKLDNLVTAYAAYKSGKISNTKSPLSSSKISTSKLLKSRKYAGFMEQESKIIDEIKGFMNSKLFENIRQAHA